jgi:mono/diheme cytochrome c family protein
LLSVDREAAIRAKTMETSARARKFSRGLALTVAAAAIWVAWATLAAREQGDRRQLPPLAIESLGPTESFGFYCAPCHGRGGRGDGPVALALRVKPADLTTLAERSGGEYPSDRVRAFVTGTGRPVEAHGASDMPVWGPAFRALDASDTRAQVRIDGIVDHIESLQRVENGATLFRQYCASCHGSAARGNGPMASALRKAPPDLTQYAKRNGGMFPSERVQRIIDGRDVASHGDPSMPVWGDAFRRASPKASDETVSARIAALVRYLQSIQERAAE